MNGASVLLPPMLILRWVCRCRSHKKLKHKDVMALEIRAKVDKDTQSAASMMLSVLQPPPQQELKPGTIGTVTYPGQKVGGALLATSAVSGSEPIVMQPRVSEPIVMRSPTSSAAAAHAQIQAGFVQEELRDNTFRGEVRGKDGGARSEATTRLAKARRAPNTPQQHCTPKRRCDISSYALRRRAQRDELQYSKRRG